MPRKEFEQGERIEFSLDRMGRGAPSGDQVRWQAGTYLRVAEHTAHMKVPWHAIRRDDGVEHFVAAKRIRKLTFQERTGWLTKPGWHGGTHQVVMVIGETATRYRIQAIVDTRLAGSRALPAGERALVPKYAIVFEEPK